MDGTPFSSRNGELAFGDDPNTVVRGCLGEVTSRMASGPERTLTFREYIAEVHPSFHFYRHVEVLISVLQDVADGERDRVMIFMPPRHGKSEVVSRLFPAYYLYRNPEKFVGVNSYSAELAYTFSRNARDNFQRGGGTLKDDAAAVKHWETGDGGGLWAAGVGGPITGKGFHVGIIDDPLKNAEEAGSPTIRRKQKDWYGSTFYTRKEPGAAIVVVQTRWHPEDLSGYLLDNENQSEEPEGWHVVNFDALRAEPVEWPDACTAEPDWRDLGEALCPPRYSEEDLRKIKANITSKHWSALYQQQPVDSEGAIWGFDMIERGVIDSAALQRIVIGVDPAGGGGDEIGIVACGVDRSGQGYVLADRSMKGSPNSWAREVADLYDRLGADRVVAEKNFGGDMVESTLRTANANLPVKMVNASRGKSVRAEPVAALYEQGRVQHVKRFEGLEGQMTSWDPATDKNSPDRVDALVWALTELMLGKRSTDWSKIRATKISVN